MPNLTAAQSRVVHAPAVELMAVQALAGTGKTQVIIERIDWLVSQKVRPSQISVICFSRDAVQQLQRRLEDRHLGEVHVATLHSLCIRFLNRVNEQPIVLGGHKESSELIKAMHEVVQWDEKGLTNGRKLPDFGQYLDYLQQTILPGQTRLSEETEQSEDMDVRLVEELRQFLNQQKWTTFTHCLVQTLERLRARPSEVELILPGCRYLISDEYQDVSPLQDALFDVLSIGRFFMVVGDPSQSVYAFQGASPSRLEGMLEMADFSERLLENFRSPAHLLFLANGLLGGEHRLLPTRSPDGDLQIYHFDERSDIPFEQLSSEVRRVLLELPGSQPDQLAILVRNNDMAGLLARALLKAGIPSTVAGDREDKKQLTLAVQCGLIPILRCWVALQTGQFGEDCPLKWLLAPDGETQIQLSLEAGALLKLAWTSRRKVADIRALSAEYPDLLAELDFILQVWSKLEERLAESGAESELGWLAYVQTLAGTLWPEVPPGEWKIPFKWDELLGKSVATESRPPVTISTIHKAKGGQWPYVILWEGVSYQSSGIFPDWWDTLQYPPMRIFGDRIVDEDEELRLRYIALTRSTGGLTVFLSKQAMSKCRDVLSTTNINRARSIQRIFGPAGGPLLPEDKTNFLEIMTAGSFLRTYAEVWWPEHAPVIGIERAIRMLEKAGRVVPLSWRQCLVGGVTTGSKGSSIGIQRPVSRLPLRKI